MAASNSKNDVHFKVVSLQNMKMTIKREQSSCKHIRKVSRLSEFNNNRVANSDSLFDQRIAGFSQEFADDTTHAVGLETEAMCSFDVITIKSEPHWSWGEEVDTSVSKCCIGKDKTGYGETFPSSDISGKGVLASDLQTGNIFIKTDPCSEKEKQDTVLNSRLKIVKTEHEARLGFDTSWIKTEPVWEFESETHVKWQSDMMGPIVDGSPDFIPATSVPVTARTRAAASGFPSDEDILHGFNQAVVKLETNSDEEEAMVSDDFVVEIDVAVESLDGFEESAENEQLLDKNVKLERKNEEEEEEENDLPVQFKQPPPPPSVGLSRRNKKQGVKKKKHVCSVCDMDFSSGPLCIQHLQTQHMTEDFFTCVQCNLVFTHSSDLLEHKKTHDHSVRKKFRHRCEECGMTFSSLRDLRCHTRRHTENKAYKCPDCDKVFTHTYTLTLHKRLHAVKKDYTCEECGMSFHRPEYLKHHRRKHSGERPFVCRVCCKTFTNSSNLSAHLRTHTGEKPYKCCVCLATFTTSSALTVHKWRHTDTKPFTCEYCARTFTTANTYKRHKVMHTGQRDFKCMECGKTFTQPSSLTIHMRTHTGERPFYCTECGATFTQSAHLTVHVRTHTGERPFVCNLCSQAYPRSEYLLRHKRRVHGLTAAKPRVNGRAIKMQPVLK